MLLLQNIPECLMKLKFSLNSSLSLCNFIWNPTLYQIMKVSNCYYNCESVKVRLAFVAWRAMKICWTKALAMIKNFCRANDVNVSQIFKKNLRLLYKWMLIQSIFPKYLSKESKIMQSICFNSKIKVVKLFLDNF